MHDVDLAGRAGHVKKVGSETEHKGIPGLPIILVHRVTTAACVHRSLA